MTQIDNVQATSSLGTGDEPNVTGALMRALLNCALEASK